MSRSVGIDDIYVYVPATRLDLLGEEFIEARRGKLSAEEFEGKLRHLGVQHAAVPDGGQTIATVGATAVYRLMAQNDIQPEQIGRLYGATESSYDNAKPFTTDVKGMLGQNLGSSRTNHWHTMEYKFACNAAGAAILDCADWILADPSPGVSGREAIVVAVDHGKYPLGSAGEITGGFGGVAIRIKQDPRLLVLDPEVRGYSSRDAYDFWKPTKMAVRSPGGATSFESHAEMPLVDSQLSIDVYQDTMRDAADAARTIARRKGIVGKNQPMKDVMRKAALHIPFPDMGRKGMARWFLHDIRGTAEGEEIEAEIGKEPLLESFSSVKAFDKAMSDHMKKLRQVKPFRNYMDSVFEDSVVWSRSTGNAYTASQPIALASMFKQAAIHGERLEGKYVGLGFYGSGAEAIVTIGKVAPGWRNVAWRMSIEDDRVRMLTMDEYSLLHRHSDQPMDPIVEPENEWMLTGIDDMGRRTHKFIEKTDASGALTLEVPQRIPTPLVRRVS
ncbi:MAG: hydroxymethylglutaryl-CoA synthase family protein [Candidatus Aenigmatarchaeota archaeon]|nr:MAG: hydroxymethylglutaryl-CoA synthase family protein [Candidatus Aenigmarchaeota archaeon]